jgi:hypothetical protein
MPSASRRVVHKIERPEIGRGITMNAITLAACERFGTACEEPGPDKSLDMAWNVLEAANDLGDAATVEACRRVIDASLKGTLACQSDLRIVTGYFR